MGVTGLWTVVQPCARPIRLETLNKKRLAVDASIWIYQFLKAVRDKEGNALRNAHIVGFFRRICKLLYFGIKPVFVFDGGAPELKRQTIAARRRRREGRQDDATRTAGKLLSMQLQKKAEEEAAKSRGRNNAGDQEEPLPQELVYADEALLPPNERQRERRQFRKKDAYHLPELDVSFEQMGGPDDPRIMSHEDLEEYAKQFHSGETFNFYDFSKIDFDSPFFLSLPASDRYNILNAARLRSRLRMGYSKSQLDSMFPNRMEFSKFQIERVKERNDLTQRLMNINGMNGEEAFSATGAGSRIASEKNREYVLVKDSSVEGGWALGVLGNKGEGREDKPIDVERYAGQPLSDEDDDDDGQDDGDAFEDVPIEGLNRLPKLDILEPGVFDDALQNPADINQSRQPAYDSRRGAVTDNQTSFLSESVDHDTLFVEDGVTGIAPESEGGSRSDDEALQQAIQMSMQSPSEEPLEVDTRSKAVEFSTSGRGTEAADRVFESDDDDADFFAALSKSKATAPTEQKPLPRFDGLLPFEPLKRPQAQGPTQTQSAARVDDGAGGFVRPSSREEDREQESEPLPPWFTAVSQKRDFIAQEPYDQYSGVDKYRSAGERTTILGKSKPPEVIDVDRTPSPLPVKMNFPKQDEGERPGSAKTAPSNLVGGEHTEDGEASGELHAPVATICESEPKETLYVSGDKGVNEWPAVGVDANDAEQQPQHKSPSPTPEFEDVALSKAAKGLEIAAVQQGDESTHAHELHQSEEVSNYGEENDFSDPEDAELLHQLSMEADEHARFASTLNAKSQTENAFDFEKEMKQLRSQQKKDRRDADEVTHIMITECQQLLRLFGLPYITAPMEAEAQCAELVSLGLVDGIVTDDSDIFLFGGNRIYKNMFNQAKYVECYLTSDLEKEYALDRQKLVRIAHLLGSDYTEGIPGVGPVTALEILTEFSTLEEFRDWWSQVQTGAKLPEDEHSTFRKKFKKKATKLFLPPSFPDKRVDVAYLQPEVDADPSGFQWGVPDLNALRQFLMTTIGWSQERTDEVLVPVIRDANRREHEGTQSNITNFFEGPQGSGAFAPRRRAEGKTRMEKAFGRLRNEAEARQRRGNAQTETPDVVDMTSKDDRSKTTKRRAKGKASPVQDPASDGSDGGEGTASRNSRKKQRRNRS